MNTENVLINSNFEKRSTNKIHCADENKTLHETCAMFIALYCPILNNRRVQAFTSVYLYLISYPIHAVSYEYQKTFYLALPLCKWYMYTGRQHFYELLQYVQAVVSLCRSVACTDCTYVGP